MTDPTQPAETPADTTPQVTTTPEVKPVEPAAAEAPTPAPSDDPAASHDDPGEIPADETQPKKKKGGGFQDRINELTKKNYEKDFEIERLQRELQEVKKRYYEQKRREHLTLGEEGADSKGYKLQQPQAGSRFTGGGFSLGAG